MTQALKFVGAFLCFIIAGIALWSGRATLATSIPLMVFVCFWALMGFLLALKSNTQEALDVIVKLRPGDVLNGMRKTDPKVTVAPAEEPKP